MKIKDLDLQFLGHCGFLITCKNGKKIAIAPYNLSDNVPKADIILITHSHYDNCSIKDIEKMSKAGTTIVMPADSQSKITKIEGIDMQVIEAGDELKFGNTKIEAIPAYNVNKNFHPKGEGWLGYIIKSNDVIIYHAGDTDKIPEMRNLTGYGKHGNEFIALLPIAGKYVMDPEEAAEVASFLSPDLVIPMHYGSGVAGTEKDAELFRELCKDQGLNVKILEKI